MKQFSWIVAGLLSTAPLRTAHAQELGPELSFDARTTRSASAPRVAVDASGQSVVVWESADIFSPSNESRVYARRLRRGKWLSPLFTIGARNGATQVEPVIASDPVTGRFVVAWTDRVVDPSRVLAQVFLPSGIPQGHMLVVDDRAHLHQINPAVAMASDGGFFILWTGYQEVPTADQVKVYGRRYNATGAPRGPSFRVSDAPGALATMCGTPSGRFVATWTTSSESGYDGVVRRFDAKGRPLGAELVLPGVLGLRPMCRFEGDGFVLGWTGFENDAQVPYVQAYDAEGAPLTDPRPLAADTDVKFPSFQWAAPLAGGGFLATWFGVPHEGGDGDVFGRWMTATGEPASDPFQINATVERQQQGIAVASARMGRLMAVWASSTDDVSWAILGRTIGPPAP